MTTKKENTCLGCDGLALKNRNRVSGGEGTTSKYRMWIDAHAFHQAEWVSRHLIRNVRESSK